MKYGDISNQMITYIVKLIVLMLFFLINSLLSYEQIIVNSYNLSFITLVYIGTFQIEIKYLFIFNI